MPDDRTIDFVVMFIVIGALGLGLLSMLVGHVMSWLDTVKTYRLFMSHSRSSETADEQTDQTDQPDRLIVSAIDPWLARLEVDRTKTALIELMVYSGWTTGEIRAVIKGDNGAIGLEVEAARERLGLDPPERQLRVRDGSGERIIPLR